MTDPVFLAFSLRCNLHTTFATLLGMLVPIYILVMGFSPKHAIPLSNITVFGGSVANTLLNTRKRHPNADRPLVDWDLILVMEPLTIAGALIGAFLNKVLPELLLTVLLVVLLSVTAYKSLKKAIKMYEAETLAMQKRGSTSTTGESELTRMAAEQEGSDNSEAGDKLLDNMEEQEEQQEEENEEKAAQAKQLNRERQKIQDELDQILEDERYTPSANLSILVTLFVVVLAINLLKGGGAFPSPVGIRCGSTAFWMANAIMLGWILVISAFVRQYLLRKYEAKKRCNFQYVEGDIQWDGRATVVYPCICCLAGFFAGMFGVGAYGSFLSVIRFLQCH